MLHFIVLLSNKTSRHLFLLIVFPMLLSFSNKEKSKARAPENKPIEVSVTLRINKIYNINSVNETL